MLRTNSPPEKCVISANIRTKTWVLIFRNNLLAAEDQKEKTPDLVVLRHPRSGGGAMFLFSQDDTIIQEVFSLSEGRSWFINDSVRENGKLHVSTPVDPMFLVLPYLKKSKEDGKVVPLKDLLVDNLFPETLRILKSVAVKNLHWLADRKGSEDLNAWMYNEEKTVKWLCRKTERVAQILKEKKINIGGNATSKNFVKSAPLNPAYDATYYLKFAHGLVSEYLTDDLSLKLLSSLGLPDESPEKKGTNKRRPSQIERTDNDKKVKWEEEIEELSKPQKSKNFPTKAKEKAAMKTASGSKCITSFFKRK